MPTLELATATAACDAIVDLIDAGSTAGTCVFETSGDAEVATCTFSDPAFGGAVNGVATASTITDDSSATGGEAAQVSFYDSDSTKIMECTLGVGSSQDFDISSMTIGTGDTVSVSALTVTVPTS